MVRGVRSKEKVPLLNIPHVCATTHEGISKVTSTTAQFIFKKRKKKRKLNKRLFLYVYFRVF